MATRGILRSVIPASFNNALVVRASGGPTVLKDLSNERVAMTMQDASRIDAAAVAVQVFVGGEHETQSIKNLNDLIDAGLDYGIPVLGVTAVGRDLVRDARYLGLATRVIAEFGAQMVKTYYCDDFEQVTAGCPVPVIMAGGKKLPLLDALTMARRAIDGGAAGVDMGRNIFQRTNPPAMIQAVSALVHEDLSAADAAEFYRDLADGADD
ncbi:MAG: 3-hydroxy-5-phosphonooxypentane-2,4-dione thiolase [Arachnia propionica]|nr:MAG: 3-hydroxy-5-phosphonooxypentane-2,4-dione thiolase [Arachnia propionica]